MTIQPQPGSPDSSHSLWPRVVPCTENCNDRSNSARLLYYYGGPTGGGAPRAKQTPPATPAEVYGVSSTGALSWQEAEDLVGRAGERYSEDCKRVLGEGSRDYPQCSGHANRMQNTQAPGAVRGTMTGVVRGLQRDGLLPPDLVVATEDDIDADLSCIGTLSGVLELATGRILPPDEARQKLVLASTDVEYDPEARHPRVDEILPPIGPEMVHNPMYWYRAAILGYAMVHEPAREFMWEICAAGSGKSTFVNAIQQGLGKSYAPDLRPEALRPDPRRTASSHNGDLRHLGKPARFAFVNEFEGQIDAGIVKAASGGDDVTLRRIYIEDGVVDVTAHIWFMGDTQDEGGARLGITADDENTRALLDRAKLLERDPVPNPDITVVREQVKELEFRKAVLARIVEYTMAAAVLDGFPPDLPSNERLLAAQRQAEMADWQREWVPGVIRERSAADSAVLPACATQVYEDLAQWWKRYGRGKLPTQSKVTREVKRQHGAEAERQHCPQHNKTEQCYLTHVMSQPISLAV